MYLAAIKTSNMVAELNIQHMGVGRGPGAALVTGPRLQVSGPASHFLKKKKSEGQSLSEVILRIERVLHENQSVNQGQLRAGMWSRLRRRTPPTRTRTHPASRAPIPPQLPSLGGT